MNVDRRLGRLTQPLLMDVAHDANDLDVGLPGVQHLAHGALSRPVSLGERLVHDQYDRSTGAIGGLKIAPALERGADRPEEVRADVMELHARIGAALSCRETELRRAAHLTRTAGRKVANGARRLHAGECADGIQYARVVRGAAQTVRGGRRNGD